MQQLRYDVSGNILCKSDVRGSHCHSGENYFYGADGDPGSLAGPHAVTRVNSTSGNRVFVYNGNGNLISDSKDSDPERSFEYTPFNKVRRLSQHFNTGMIADRHSEFYYGPSRARFLQRKRQGAVVERTHYVGNVEFVYAGATLEPGTVPTARRSVAGVALVISEPNGYEHTLYQHRDHLGSLVALSTSSGRIESRMSFDAWGNRRDPARVEPPWWHWSSPVHPGWASAMIAHTPRGFTGHEHLDWHGIIHMNGRIYDPFLARFLQADPFMEDTGTLNRYTYVFNNPLAYTDPSGYLSFKEFARIAIAVAITVYSGGSAKGLAWGLWGKTVTTGQALATVAVGGVLSNRVATGSWSGSVTAAFTAMAFYGVGQGLKGAEWAKGDFVGELSGPGLAAKTVSHGLIGGISAELQGGKFGHGFLSSGATAAASPYIDGAFNGDRFLQGMTAAMVGGTVSELTGGKFANGAVTSAMAFAFNQVLSGEEEQDASADANADIELALEVAELYVPGWDIGACIVGGECTVGDWLIAGAGIVPAGKSVGRIANATKSIRGTLREPNKIDTIAVDSRGNAIPLRQGEHLTGSSDGRWIQVRDANGNPTGMRIDGPHNPNTHSDPRALRPHAHLPGRVNSDGTPWIPIKE